MTARKYDLVLFGATGYTGGLTADYLARWQGPEKFRWAIAGRSREKLEAVQARLRQLGAKVDLVIADSGDDASLRALARAARVVITTVGPYIRYGEPLVRACVEEGTDYVDLTGEPMFVDRMIERYHARAAEQRVKIVNACGFDSIPHDLGAFFAVQALREKAGPLDGAAVKLRGYVRARGSFSGGTWHSALHAMGQAREHERGRKQRGDLRPRIGTDRKVGQLPPSIHRQQELAKWALPLPTIDPEVVCRSALLYPEYGRSFSYGHYIALPNLPFLAGTVVGMTTLFGLAQFRATRTLLEKVKDPGEGPSEETRARGWFEVTMLGEAEHDGRSESIRCQVQGGDPGYGDTAKMLAESALCLVLDRARLPEHYGVVPPAAAMGEPLIARLRAAGMSFQVLA